MTVMRIIDLQRRLREIGRIRTGDTTVAANGKTRPRKLERFRLTSRDRKVIDAASATWGGEVSEWQAPDGGQWQCYLEAAEIAVVVPPGDMSFSQSYEQWSAGGCQVRCDGQWDHIGDRACACDPSARACDIHTRLSVMVPQLPGIGVWRLETHSYYAAVELGGLVDLCAAQAAAGAMIPARLRLEQRSVKRPGRNGKVETRRFAVPVLDLDVHPLALGAGGAGVAGQLDAGSAAALPPARPALTPVPEPERALIPSVAEQVGAVDEDRPRESGRRQQATVPRTGLRPRTADQAAEVMTSPAPSSPAPSAPADGATPCSVCGESFRDGRPVRRGRAGESAYVHKEHDGPADVTAAPIDDTCECGEPSGPHNLSDHNAVPPPPAEESAPAEHRNAAGQRPPATITAKQVGTRSSTVFKAEYDAAPKGGKTRIVERLRHALVYAQTGGHKSSTSACTVDELLAVWARLDDISEGRLTYEVEPSDGGGVTWITGSGKRVSVMWAELAGDPAAEQESEGGDGGTP